MTILDLPILLLTEIGSNMNYPCFCDYMPICLTCTKKQKNYEIKWRADCTCFNFYLSWWQENAQRSPNYLCNLVITSPSPFCPCIKSQPLIILHMEEELLICGQNHLKSASVCSFHPKCYLTLMRVRFEKEDSSKNLLGLSSLVYGSTVCVIFF